MTLSVISWFWRQTGGRAQYEAAHVAIWADQVRRHLTLPHRLCCVTSEQLDLPSHIEIIAPPDDFAAVRIPSWPEARPQCLRRLSMFRPDAAAIFGPRFVSMDLDLVVGDSLDPLLGCDDEFRICEGTAPGRPYNGSMMILTAGARPQAFTEFTPKAAAEAGSRFLGSDQAWLAHALPNEATWGEADGVTFYGLARSSETVRRVMFFPGGTKPWHRRDDPWIRQHYRRDPQGRCLMLGYGKTIWADLDRVIDQGPYGGVIASPEAAEHWPAPLTAMAMSDREANELAEMHGFETRVWCGKSVEV